MNQSTTNKCHTSHGNNRTLKVEKNTYWGFLDVNVLKTPQNTSMLVCRFLLIVLAYFCTAKLGLMVPYKGTVVALIWVPTGIAVAAILRWGKVSPTPILLAIYSAAVLVELSVKLPLTAALLIGVSNTLAPFCTAYLLDKLDFKGSLIRVQDIWPMLFAALFGMLVSAFGGVAILYIFGLLKANDLANTWLAWWAGDTVGVLLALPLLLNISKENIKSFWHSRYKFLTWFVLFALVEFLMYKILPNSNSQFVLSLLLIVPMLIWVTMHFGILGASSVVIAVTTFTVWVTAQGYGPFYPHDMPQGVGALWIFVVTLVVTMLLISLTQTDLYLAALALRNNEEKLRAIIDGALDAIVSIDESGNLVEFNPAAERIFGYTKQQVVGRPLGEMIIPPVDRKKHNKAHQNFVISGKKHIFDRRLELNAMRSDGSEFPVELTLTSLKDKGLPFVTGFIRDITESKKAEKEIHQLAFYDALTGLPNRRLFHDRLKQVLISKLRVQNYGALLFIDLDNFKVLNDSRGHDIGDLLLMQVAERLNLCLRAQDTVARLGGDEFVIILDTLHESLQQSLMLADGVAEKILHSINQPYYIKEFEHHNSSSIGVSIFSAVDQLADEVLKRADTAMYEAKVSGKNAIRFFDPAMQVAVEKRVEMELQLRGALLHNQLKLHYQIQVDEVGNVLGVEALLRWMSEGNHLAMPAQFIALAEDTGLIVPIGDWVLNAACEQLKKWEANDFTKGLFLAVNVSVKQFRQADFVLKLKALIEATDINPDMLKLEITESVAMDDMSDTITKMRDLRAIGLRLSIDDFGTGYSSFSYLRQLPFSQIKIDRSFVKDITTDMSSETIVNAIILMTKAMDIKVVAEGVETKAQFELLKKHGCKQFQGYFFGRAVPIEVLEENFKEKNSYNSASPKSLLLEI